MEPMIDIQISVNGLDVATRVPARQTLVDFLRYNLELTGSHIGCEHGSCGACTIRLNGDIVRGCLVLVGQANGATVETIEGLSDGDELADLQSTFHALNALQCGYCTPGMLLTAQALLTDNPDPSREEIRSYLSGNYCRCTGYQAIVDAIESVATARNGAAS